jgi:drug/metabolite transporter (DMT)-like permease
MLAPALLFLPPLPAAGWLLISAHFSLHMIYKVLLLKMYSQGDFGQVFPIARGSAPVLITLIAIPAAGEFPSATAMLGVTIICLGLIGFTLEPRKVQRAGAAPIILAGAAGAVVSVYTIVDALGVRLPGAGVTFFVTLFTVDAIGMMILGLYWRRERLWSGMTTCWKPGMLGALLSVLNFSIVLWVMSFNPVGLAAAIRETSIVIAALIGTYWFKEPFGPRRIAAASIILLGIGFINWAS